MIVINIKIGAFRSRIDNVAHELNSAPYQVEIGSRFLIAGVGYVPAHMERCVREEKYDTPFFGLKGQSGPVLLDGRCCTYHTKGEPLNGTASTSCSTYRMDSTARDLKSSRPSTEVGDDSRMSW